MFDNRDDFFKLFYFLLNAVRVFLKFLIIVFLWGSVMDLTIWNILDAISYNFLSFGA